jgi:hypothetical protein
MATTGNILDSWRKTLETLLQYYADLPYRYGDVSAYVVVSRDRNHFMLETKFAYISIFLDSKNQNR